MTSAAGGSAVAPPDRPERGWHEAVAFSTPGDLAARIASRVVAATATGGPVLAVLADDTRQALETVLGAQAAEVEFHDPAEVYDVPAFTVATRWARTNRRIRTAGGRAMVVAEHLEELPGCGPDYWARLDIALDVATAELPVTVLCPFRRSPALIHATHPHVGTADGVGPGRGYRPPQLAVIDFPPPPPPDLGVPAGHRPFDLHTLAELRGTVDTIGAAGGLDLDQTADLVLAVNELASNSIEHGAGAGVLRMWDDDAGVVAEVWDGGHMDMPFPGLTLPPPQGERGRGLWLASELCDVLQAWSDPAGGTTIRVRINR
jgi:anti-sigma regulatory factor (Ser/Thr protein kinase)